MAERGKLHAVPSDRSVLSSELSSSSFDSERSTENTDPRFTGEHVPGTLASVPGKPFFVPSIFARPPEGPVLKSLISADQVLKTHQDAQRARETQRNTPVKEPKEPPASAPDHVDASPALALEPETAAAPERSSERAPPGPEPDSQPEPSHSHPASSLHVEVPSGLLPEDEICMASPALPCEPHRAPQEVQLEDLPEPASASKAAPAAQETPVDEPARWQRPPELAVEGTGAAVDSLPAKSPSPTLPPATPESSTQPEGFLRTSWGKPPTPPRPATPPMVSDQRVSTPIQETKLHRAKDYRKVFEWSGVEGRARVIARPETFRRLPKGPGFHARMPSGAVDLGMPKTPLPEKSPSGESVHARPGKQPLNLHSSLPANFPHLSGDGAARRTSTDASPSYRTSPSPAPPRGHSPGLSGAGADTRGTAGKSRGPPVPGAGGAGSRRCHSASVQRPAAAYAAGAELSASANFPSSSAPAAGPAGGAMSDVPLSKLGASQGGRGAAVASPRSGRPLSGSNDSWRRHHAHNYGPPLGSSSTRPVSAAQRAQMHSGARNSSPHLGSPSPGLFSASSKSVYKAGKTKQIPENAEAPLSPVHASKAAASSHRSVSARRPMQERQNVSRSFNAFTNGSPGRSRDEAKKIRMTSSRGMQGMDRRAGSADRKGAHGNDGGVPLRYSGPMHACGTAEWILRMHRMANIGPV